VPDYFGGPHHGPLAQGARAHLFTAARSGELLSLTTRMIDQTGATWIARLGDHKTVHQGKQRTLYFGPQAAHPPSLPETSRPDVRLWKQKSFRDALVNACAKLGIRRFVPHELRTTALTRIREQFGAEPAQAVAGHAHLSTTELYAQMNAKQAMEVIGKVG
jgi:integrase